MSHVWICLAQEIVPDGCRARRRVFRFILCSPINCFLSRAFITCCRTRLRKWPVQSRKKPRALAQVALIISRTKSVTRSASVLHLLPDRRRVSHEDYSQNLNDSYQRNKILLILISKCGVVEIVERWRCKRLPFRAIYVMEMCVMWPKGFPGRLLTASRTARIL